MSDCLLLLPWLFPDIFVLFLLPRLFSFSSRPQKAFPRVRNTFFDVFFLFQYKLLPLFPSFFFYTLFEFLPGSFWSKNRSSKNKRGQTYLLTNSKYTKQINTDTPVCTKSMPKIYKGSRGCSKNILSTSVKSKHFQAVKVLTNIILIFM